MGYSRARLIRMANARKNHVNYPSMRIIRAYFTLRFNQRSKVVSWTTMQIIREVRISEGQIIRAILYSMLDYYYSVSIFIESIKHQMPLTPIQHYAVYVYT